MLTRKMYTVTYEENNQRIREEYRDTYFAGIRISRSVRRGIR